MKLTLATLNKGFGLYEKSGQAFCDSLMVSESFEKQHAHVLRDIESVLTTFGKINQSKFGEINFLKSTYKDGKNRKQPKHLLTKDGFTYLTMGYDGEKAAQFKIDYINCFNKMEEFINTLLTTKIEFPFFTEAIKGAHEGPKPHHFLNEINMIYKIVLGVSAKTFRENNGLKKDEVIKPHLTIDEVNSIEMLQRVDVGLYEAGLSYEQRKEILSSRFIKSKLRLLA